MLSNLQNRGYRNVRRLQVAEGAQRNKNKNCLIFGRKSRNQKKNKTRSVKRRIKPVSYTHLDVYKRQINRFVP